jgi:rRNA-processing protein FCF1
MCSYAQTKPYIKDYVMEELDGLASTSKGQITITDLRNVMW